MPQVEVIQLIGYPHIMHVAQREDLGRLASALWDNNSVEVRAIPRYPKSRSV